MTLPDEVDGGMVAPALLYLVIAGGTGPKGGRSPTATDIDFALTVLAVILRLRLVRWG